MLGQIVTGAPCESMILSQLNGTVQYFEYVVFYMLCLHTYNAVYH
jgi:hypothetical protein